MRSPRVSILTLTYNHEAFIARCIASVLAQTERDWELVVLDDGSTDETPALVASFANPRIRYVRRAHAGVAKLAEGYNHALSLARADRIAILEGDDYWPESKLATQLPDFDDPDVVLSFGRTQEVDVDGTVRKTIPDASLPQEALTNTPVGRAALFFLDVDVLTFAFPVSVVLRREALRRIGGFQALPGLPLVDYPTFLRLTCEGRFAFHPEVLGYWQRHASSTTRNRFYDILAGVRRCGERFRAEHGAALPIAPHELARIDRGWNALSFIQWYTLGRWHLADGERRRALRAFGRARGVATTRHERRLVRDGLVATVLGLDLEKRAARLELQPLRPLLEQMNAENVMVSKKMLDDVSA